MSLLLRKTPVMFLNELCIKRGYTVAFEIISLSPIFGFKVTVGLKESIGEGKNKMKAKHEAALNMIKLIVKETPAHKDITDDELDKMLCYRSESSRADSESSEPLTNYVGILQNKLQEMKVKFPVYTYTSDMSIVPPRFICNLSTGSAPGNCVRGFSTTKKLSKQDAARRFLKMFEPDEVSQSKMDVYVNKGTFEMDSKPTKQDKTRLKETFDAPTFADRGYVNTRDPTPTASAADSQETTISKSSKVAIPPPGGYRSTSPKVYASPILSSDSEISDCSVDWIGQTHRRKSTFGSRRNRVRGDEGPREELRRSRAGHETNHLSNGSRSLHSDPYDSCGPDPVGVTRFEETFSAFDFEEAAIGSRAHRGLRGCGTATPSEGGYPGWGPDTAKLVDGVQMLWSDEKIADDTRLADSLDLQTRVVQDNCGVTYSSEHSDQQEDTSDELKSNVHRSKHLLSELCRQNNYTFEYKRCNELGIDRPVRMVMLRVHCNPAAVFPGHGCNWLKAEAGAARLAANHIRFLVTGNADYI